MHRTLKQAPRAVYLATALLFSSALGAEPGEQEAPMGDGERARRLQKGGDPHLTPEIDATEMFGRTLVEVVEGAIYEFEVQITSPLRDKTIEVKDTAGFTTGSQGFPTRAFLWFAESKRRLPEENWFHLAGTVGRSEAHHFPIGNGARPVRAPATGELFCFLNDHPKHYSNNQGRFRLKITRR